MFKILFGGTFPKRGVPLRFGGPRRWKQRAEVLGRGLSMNIMQPVRPNSKNKTVQISSACTHFLLGTSYGFHQLSSHMGS